MADELTPLRRKVRDRLQEKENLLSTVKMRITGSVLLPDNTMSTTGKVNAEELRNWLERELGADVEALKEVLREIG